MEGIHLEGGTMLGTSRGGADMRQIVKQIDLWGIDMVCLGCLRMHRGWLGEPARCIQLACAADLWSNSHLLWQLWQLWAGQ